MITLHARMKISSLPHKTKQFFFVLIKLSILFGAGYFIYDKLANNPELSFSHFIQFTSKNDVFSPATITLLLIFTLFNWFFEILKWQKLVSVVQNISFKDAIKQSLGALTVSLFTPNRIGEYGAKALYYHYSTRKKILLVNLINNMLQMSITVTLGFIGCILFARTYHVNLNYEGIVKLAIFLSCIAVFFGIGISKNWFRIKRGSINKTRTFFTEFPKDKLILGWILSFLRYTIFSLQFYVFIMLFNINISYLEAMVIITTMYFLASIIPSIFIFDVVVKGSIAVYLFSFLGIHPISILCIVTLMWLLNFAIPSCLGSFYVINFKWPK